MELDWLGTFLAVADHGGFTAASARVHRSQSRVSAHIAALERELGVRLIDRTRRPATLTPAGRIFVEHAREILADVGSARSAISVLRAMDEESLAVLTTPCIGAALFPRVISQLVRRYPRARIALSEHGWRVGERRHPADGFVLAVLPTLTHPHGPGLQEQVLWKEPIQAVVPNGHELVRETNMSSPTISPSALSGYPLVIGAMSVNAESEITSMMMLHGITVASRVVVDAPQTLVGMVRGGVGVGVVNAVALENADTAGVSVLNFDDPEMVREVAAYWYDVLLTTEVGERLHETVLRAPPPAGAMPVVRADVEL